MPGRSRPPVKWHCMLICFEMLTGHKELILFLLLLLHLQLMLKTLECIHERGDISPAHHNQTPGPAGPGECYFYKPFGSLAISRKLWIQGNSRASERRMN